MYLLTTDACYDNYQNGYMPQSRSAVPRVFAKHPQPIGAVPAKAVDQSRPSLSRHTAALPLPTFLRRLRRSSLFFDGGDDDGTNDTKKHDIIEEPLAHHPPSFVAVVVCSLICPRALIARASQACFLTCSQRMSSGKGLSTRGRGGGFCMVATCLFDLRGTKQRGCCPWDRGAQ